MQEGIIIKNISNLYKVEVKDKVYACEARGKFKKDGIIPVVGDRVSITLLNEEKGIVEEILERRNYIKRPKIANITQIIYVLSMNMPKPDLLLLDKQLAFAEFLGINPVICINKIDLEKAEQILEIENLYKKIGYKVIKTNAKIGENIKVVEEILKNNITAFSGNSGVGKSTLINSIFNDKITEEGLISNKNKKGKNTTTTVELFKIDCNSYIADTPGFSTFDIYEIESNELDKYFKDFHNYIPNCEYIGCNHVKEVNCGIKDAVASGQISEVRYQSYCKIYNELKQKEENKW